MEIQNSIAINAKRIRTQKKLTLEQASKLTGVSKSMLAQIEKGDVNPTISVVWKMANGYKVSFSSLMENQNQENEIIRRLDITPVLEDHGYTNYPIFPFKEDRLFETYQIEIKKDGHLEAQPHLIGTEEYITVFTGTIEVKVDEEIYTLYPGDSIHFKADVEHSYKNIGKDDVTLSMILYYAPK